MTFGFAGRHPSHCTTLAWAILRTPRHRLAEQAEKFDFLPRGFPLPSLGTRDVLHAFRRDRAAKRGFLPLELTLVS